MTSSSRTRRRPLSRKAKLIGAAVGAVLVWQVAVISLAAGHGDDDTDLAAANYASTSPAAATAAAARHLQDNDPAGAKIFATQALTVSSISAEALRNLGLAEQALGHSQQASALFSQASALGWRDGPMQLWLAQAYIQSKDYASAAQRLDAALRIQPFATPLYDLLDQLISDKALAAAMAERLALSPDWRNTYLHYAGNGAADEALARAGLLMDLARTSAPPSPEEILPTVRALVKNDKAKEARALWLGAQHVQAGAVYDPTFKNINSDTWSILFEWTAMPILGASAHVDQGDQDSALRATTDGSASGVLMRQLTLLSPGVHVLDYKGSLSASDRGTFGWSVQCLSDKKTILNTIGASSAPPYRFEVPDHCERQFVELRVASNPSAAGKDARFFRIDIR